MSVQQESASQPPESAQNPSVSAEPGPQIVPALYFLPPEEISTSQLEQVKTALNGTTGEHLYIVIKSVGGDAYSAVRIMKHIRTKFARVEMVIPDYCYSAATLMSLGADRICVAPEGYIGPIDKPLEHDSGEPISALDITQSVSNLYSLASNNARVAYNDIRTGFGDRISRKDALQVAWDSSVKLMSPAMEKIDPVLLQKAFRDLRIGMLSGLDLLKTHEPDYYKRLYIVQMLVNNYPSHGYAIFREEMARIGLNTQNLEDCSDADTLLSYYNQPIGEIFYVPNIYDQSSNV